MNEHKEIKAGAGYTIGNVLIKGISFISLPVFSHLLSTIEFGYFNTYISYEAIITIFLGLGMHASIKTAFYDYKGKQETFISTQSLIVLFVTILLLSVYLILHNFINSFTGFTTIVTVFMIAQSFGAAMLNIVNSKLSLTYNYKFYLWYAAYNTVLNFVLSVILMFTILRDNRFLARVVGSSIPLITIGILSIYKFEHIKGKKYDAGMAKYALVFGIPLIWHYLSQQIQSQFDRIMITNMIGATATGIYSFVYTIANIFQIIFYSTDNVWGVWMLDRMEKKEYLTIKGKANQYMLLMTVIACGMMLISKEMIMVVGPSMYLEGINIFIPIIIGMYFLFLYTVFVGVEYYFKETKYIGITTFIAATVNVITNFVFIGMFGYQAAAYTTLFSYVVMFALHWLIAKKILKKNLIRPFFKFRSFAFYIVIVALWGIIVTVLNPFPIIKYFIGSIIFCSVVLITKNTWISYIKLSLKK